MDNKNRDKKYSNIEKKEKEKNQKTKNNKIKDINEYKKLRKNKHKKRKNKLLKRFYIISIAVCTFAVIVVNICGYATMSSLKYEIGSLKKDLRKEEIILEEVKVKVDTNTSIQEIESKAKEELNMDYPKENQIRYIDVEN